MFLSGIEPETFRVLGGCDNHYTTETTYRKYTQLIIRTQKGLSFMDIYLPIDHTSKVSSHHS